MLLLALSYETINNYVDKLLVAFELSISFQSVYFCSAQFNIYISISEVRSYVVIFGFIVLSQEYFS